MKKRTALLLLFFAFFYNGEAQNNPLKRTLFGVKLGATHTVTDFNKGVLGPAVPVTVDGKIGVSASAFLNVHLSRRFSLQTEYGFLTASATRKDSGTTYSLAYLFFPLLLKYSPVRGLHLVGGPQFDLLLHATKKKAGIAADITHDTEERNIGLTGGLEYFFINAFSLSVRYTKGLNNIGIGQRSNIEEYKSRQVMVTAGFYF